MTYITLFGILLLIAIAFGEIYVDDDFEDDSWRERWVIPTNYGHKLGRFERSTIVFYGGTTSTGLRTMDKEEEYALSTRFHPITLANKTLVLQYSVKYGHVPIPSFQEAYIKLYGCNFDPMELDEDTAYLLEFGSHLREDWRFGLFGETLWSVYRYLAFNPSHYTHVYTLILRPNLYYEFFVDGGTLSSKDEHLVDNQIRVVKDHGYPHDAISKICGIGLSGYQRKNGTIFDNILLSDDIDLAKRRRDAILAEVTGWKSGRTGFLVDIEAEDMNRILNCNGRIHNKENNHTNTFLQDFDKFLVPFSKSSNYSVIMATAEYNRNYWGSNVTIQLWVSFQPQQVDILDDIDPVLEAINEANFMSPKTVSTIVVSYGFLQLDNQTWPFVNREIQKVSKRLKSLPAQAAIKLALQISDINCRSKREYTKYLEANLLDFLVLMPMPQTKQFSSRERDNEKFASCAHSAYLIDIRVPPLIHSYESIEIDFDEGVYSYNTNVTHKYSSVYTKALTLIRAHDKIRRQDMVDIEEERTSKNLANWLYQPTYFSKPHFGAVISGKDIKAMRSDNFSAFILENFRYIMIDIGNHDDLKSQQDLEQVVEEMARHSLLMKEENSRGDQHFRFRSDNGKVQMSILVTIETNDFEVNKRKAERANSAAVKGYTIFPGSVNAIFFDLLSCSRSEVCSGYNKDGVSTVCWHADRIYNVSSVLHYAKYDLLRKYKVRDHNPIWIGRLEDRRFYELTWEYSHKECGERDKLNSYREFSYLLCKTILQHKDIENYGGLKASKNAIDDLAFCGSSSKTATILPVYFYVNVVGCVGGHSNLTLFVEYAILMENLNGWAVADNLLLFINAGVEPSNCSSENVDFVEQEGCGCGWWIKQESHGTYQDKKSIARQLYEKAKADEEKPKTVILTESPLWLWTLCSVIIVSALITIPTIFLIFHYRSKYILTKQEVAEFIKGRQITRAESVGHGDEAAETHSYNSEKYELPPSTFTIDITSSCLGSGEFGRVYRGSIKRESAITETAVKMANPSAVRKSHGYYLALKGLLSEIKILAYVGEHNHIVAMLGAYTGKVRKGEIAVFMELCQLGSLDKYLHTIKPQMVDDHVPSSSGTSDSDACSFDKEENERQKIQVLDKASSDELWRWAGEIASGMEFLASKKLVHADLATRNVLLTSEKTAKIADFGLSRRLYDYTEYVKQSQAPLPWRWMAPESLSRMYFNEKTDIWAFGVTLWEIFTLSDQPYPGLSWTSNFSVLLERGLRLPEPRFNLNKIYSIMLRCWDINPSMRPSFTQLKTELNIV